MFKCDTCDHKEVCKFAEEFKEFEQKQEPTNDKPFGVETKCQYYSNNQSIYPLWLQQYTSSNGGYLIK